MGAFLVILDVSLVFFGSWTISYHITALTGLPAVYAPILFCLVMGVTTIFYATKWKSTFWQNNWALQLQILILCLVCSGIALVNFRPDADDVEFFHRALIQNDILYQPYVLSDTLHSGGIWPPLSPLHVLTSYEPLMALLGKIFGLDPLWLYQNGAAAAAAFLLPIIYTLLYFEFGVPQKIIPLCVLVSLAFLLLDGNVHRSFGNVSLVRFWQGKTILWSLLLPAALFIIHRFLVTPTKRRFFSLCLVNISAVGLSNSGVFLLPLLTGSVALAFLATYGFNYRRAVATILSALPSFYPAAFAIALIIGLLPTPDTTIFQWPQSNWLQNLWLVIGSKEVLIRDIFIAAVVPLVVLRSNHRYFFLALCAAFIIIFANPITGPLWIRVLTPASYWRLLYLFPLGWCSGLVVAGLTNNEKLNRIAAKIVIPVFLLLCFMAFQSPAALSRGVKRPQDYNLSRPETEFCLKSRDLLDGKEVLAPRAVAVRFTFTESYRTIGGM